MSQIRKMEFDGLIVGGGGSGLRASLQLAQSGLKTAVISKVFPTRSHTVSAQGGITCAIASDDPNDDWGARYGFTTHEQLVFLDFTFCIYHVSFYILYGWWCASSWLDIVSSIGIARRQKFGIRSFCYPHVGYFLHHGCN